MTRSRRHVRALVLGAALYAYGAVVPHGYAQVTTAITADGTLGTTVAPSGNVYNINGGTIRGTNQFHSFGQFSVGTGDIASFNGPANATIQNILSRVTGGTRSEIDGTLRSTISGANLYLLNPSGILFGPNAQLDVSGSFHATTANYIGLADGVRFNAVPSSADNLLSTAPPAAFGFLTSNPALIEVQTFAFDDVTGLKTLQVPTGKTLSFVGGPLNFGAAPEAAAGGFLFAPGGRINLVSVASPGEARFDGTGFSVDAFVRLGDINITGNSVIDGKEVFIRGGRLLIEQASILPGFVFLSGAPVDPPNGGEVNIQVSDSITIKGPAAAFSPSGILTFAGLPFPGDVPHINIKASSISLSDGGSIATQRQGPGNPGNISIQADTVEVRSGASIAARNEFEGPGGTLTIDARNVTLDSAGSDQPTGLSSQADFHGDYGVVDFSPSLQLADSGAITVNATGTLTMRGSAQISTDNFAFGRSGNVTVNAAEMLLTGAGANTGLISAQSRLAGRPGDVTVNASGSIDMQNGFRISASTLGSDDAGQVNVRAGRSITMTGASTFISGITGAPVDTELNSFAARFSPFFGVENPPGLDYPSLRTALGVAPSPNDLMNVLAALRALSDGAGNPLVAATDFTPGAGGKVSITTPILAVNDGAHIETSTVWDGNAGAITLDVGSLTVRDGAIIGSRSGAVRPDRGFTVGAGNAGTVTIAADTVEIAGRSPASGQGSLVTTSTSGDGQGGDVSITAGSSVSIVNGGLVSADSLGGEGLAGNINISAGNEIVMNDGSVSTRAVSADGGNITLTTTGSLVRLTNSQVTTSVESGIGTGGNITISSELIALNDSRIRADAFGGPGGNINIFADVFLTSGALVSASSALSTPGVIDIQANITDVSGTLTPLPSAIVEAATLLQASCAARLASGKTSSLVLAGREGIPPEPDGLQSSPLAAAIAAALAPSAPGVAEHATILPRIAHLSLTPKCAW
jgi:filamentous hemagglutinin family protein